MTLNNLSQYDDDGEPLRSPHPLRPSLPPGVLWSAAQLHDFGVATRQLNRFLADGQIRRIRHGCYVSCGHWESLNRDGQRLLEIRAHQLRTLRSTNEGFVYSHVSAARLFGLSLWNVDSLIHVTNTTKPNSRQSGPGVRIHTRPLPPEDVVWLDGLRVTSLERTLVDCCMTVSYKSGLILMDDALRKGASIGKLEKASTALAGHRGIRTLRAVLENADPRSESAGETLAREVINALQLPAPELQVEVHTRAGLYRLDMAWRDRKIALEFDGRAKYFDYQPSDEAIFQERQREKALMEEGWIFVRLTWADLFKEAEVKSRILEAFRRSRGIASNP